MCAPIGWCHVGGLLPLLGPLLLPLVATVALLPLVLLLVALGRFLGPMVGRWLVLPLLLLLVALGRLLLLLVAFLLRRRLAFRQIARMTFPSS